MTGGGEIDKAIMQKSIDLCYDEMNYLTLYLHRFLGNNPTEFPIDLRKAQRPRVGGRVGPG